MARLAGKIALVTGAGSMKGGMGNGKATAIRLAQEGAAIAALDLDQNAAEETCDLIRQEGGRAFALTADVTQEDQVKAAIAQCLSEFGQIDILQNNVGILKAGGAMDSSVEDWDAMVNVNMKAVFLPTKHVLPHFVERGARGGDQHFLHCRAAISGHALHRIQRHQGLDHFLHPQSGGGNGPARNSRECDPSGFHRYADGARYHRTEGGRPVGH